MADLEERLSALVAEVIVPTVKPRGYAKRKSDAGLDLTLFAWWCATGDTVGRADQLARAAAAFGQEERWPRLSAQFERVAARYGVELSS